MLAGRQSEWVGRGTLALAVAVFVAACLHFVNFSYDDAFISFRYAENLASGHGLVFNPGERVEGYSNFAWTLLLAVPALLGASKLELGMLVAAKALGGFSALASLLLLGRGARFPIGALYLAALAPFAVWAMAGLEAPLVGLWLLVVVLLDERERSGAFQGVPWSALALAGAALTRPEPVLLFWPLLALRWRELPAQRRVRAGVAYAVTFWTPCGWLLLARRSYYGEWLPNTYFAKRGGDPEAWQRGADYLARASAELGLGLMVVTCCVLLWCARRWSRSCTLLLVMLLTHAFCVVYDGGDWMLGHRLVVPALPLVALLLQRAWDAADQLAWDQLRLAELPAWLAPSSWTTAWNGWLERRARFPRAPVASFFSLLVGLVVLGSWGSYGPWLGLQGSGLHGLALGTGENFVIARWMRDHVDAPGVLATGEAGIIPYYTRRPLLDLFGLMDPHIAHLHGVRHRKFDAAYALSKAPRFVLLQVNRFADGHTTGAQSYAHTLLADARFAREYRLLHEFDSASLYQRR